MECLNSNCSHVYCPEHHPSEGYVPLPVQEMIEEGYSSVSLGLRPPSTTGLSQIDRIELSLFRLAEWFRGMRYGMLYNDLLQLGVKLDKSLRGE